MSRNVNKPARTAKKSYTLSLDSVTFLEDLREKQHARSASSVLDDIVQAYRRSQRRKALAEHVSRHYSSLSQAEVEDDAAWGEFAAGELDKSKS